MTEWLRNYPIMSYFWVKFPGGILKLNSSQVQKGLPNTASSSTSVVSKLDTAVQWKLLSILSSIRMLWVVTQLWWITLYVNHGSYTLMQSLLGCESQMQLHMHPYAHMHEEWSNRTVSAAHREGILMAIKIYFQVKSQGRRLAIQLKSSNTGFAYPYWYYYCSYFCYYRIVMFCDNTSWCQLTSQHQKLFSNIVNTFGIVFY